MKTNYLSSSRRQFEYYKMLGDRTFAQIDEKDFFWQYNEESNSIAVTIKHIWGNMMSRWTDFLTADGEKEWRHRETEFADDIKDAKTLLEKWEEGWNCLFKALDSVNEENFDTPIMIRNQEHTMIEAINRQMCHYSYHIGQIVYLGRMLAGKNWESLSIPKGKSEEFNKMRFSQPPSRKHFTTEFLEGNSFKNDA